MNLNIIPLLDNVIIEKIAEENKAGIIVPEHIEQKRDSGRGRVLAVGQGIRRPDGVMMPLLVKKGDIILYNRSYPVTIEGKEYSLTKEDWILAILKKKKNEK